MPVFEEGGITSATEATEAPENIPLVYLLGAGYDGKREKALLKLYEPESQKLYVWHDNTGHLPYCVSKTSATELAKDNRILRHPGFLRLETEKRFDGLLDEWIQTTKILASNPLAIGGEGQRGLRNILDKSWESHIVYYQNYLYDRQLTPGMPYAIQEGLLRPVEYKLPEGVDAKLNELFRDSPPGFRESIMEWSILLQCPVPRLRRAAVDIEVHQSVATRMPDPERGDEPITAVSFVDTEGLRKVLVLRTKAAETPAIKDADIVVYDSEKDLIGETFRLLDEYPVILTFNGDGFDLVYLKKRAQNLGFTNDTIPITVGRQATTLQNSIHIDLYRFFLNRSIQIYAFGNKYRENTLEDVATSILGKGKLFQQNGVFSMSPQQLAEYCLRDGELTFELTTFSDDLPMKLMMALSRVSRMTLEDVTRSGVSRWILALMMFEHRRRSMLIPNPEDILEKKGVTATEAVIKGKKYKGAIVRNPREGAHFSVAVLDFASLYPSIIRNWNLSYETILCPHPSCKEDKNNLVPDTPHWVCRKRQGLSSLIIGSLRDLRVRWYKPLSKDKTLSSEDRAWYDVIQSALKVFLNASYGVFGSEAFSLYCPPLAESTAAVGRDTMTKAMDKAEKLGIEVIYGDTDSVFLENPSKEKIEELVSWADKTLDVELDVDKTYRYTVFSKRKKNYLGVYPDGSIDVKGMTGKKRHVPLLLKDAFSQLTAILSEVRAPEDFAGAREEIRSLIESVYLKLKERRFDLSEISFNVMMGQSLGSYETNPQHVKAAKLLEETGTKLAAGDVISYVVTQDGIGVKPTKTASKKDVAVDKYIEYLRSMFEQLLDALDLSFDELAGRPQGTTLDSFLRRP